MLGLALDLSDPLLRYPEPSGLSRLVASGNALLTSLTFSAVHPRRPATSSSVGSRPSSAESPLLVRAILRIFSPMCTGTLMVRALSATALPIACLTHHVA